MEIVMMVSNLPRKLSELSKVDPDKAIELMQAWGDGKKDVEKIWEELSDQLSKFESNKEEK